MLGLSAPDRLPAAFAGHRLHSVNHVMQAGYRYAVITRYMSGSIHFRTQFVVYRGDGGMQSRTELVPRHDHPYGRSIRRWGT